MSAFFKRFLGLSDETKEESGGSTSSSAPPQDVGGTSGDEMDLVTRMLDEYLITREEFAKLDPSAPGEVRRIDNTEGVSEGGFRSIVDALTQNRQLPSNFQFELVSGANVGQGNLPPGYGVKNTFIDVDTGSRAEFERLNHSAGGRLQHPPGLEKEDDETGNAAGQGAPRLTREKSVEEEPSGGPRLRRDKSVESDSQGANVEANMPPGLELQHFVKNTFVHFAETGSEAEFERLHHSAGPTIGAHPGLDMDESVTEGSNVGQGNVPPGDVQQQVIDMLLANGYRWRSWSSDPFGESVVRYLQGPSEMAGEGVIDSDGRISPEQFHRAVEKLKADGLLLHDNVLQTGTSSNGSGPSTYAGIYGSGLAPQPGESTYHNVEASGFTLRLLLAVRENTADPNKKPTGGPRACKNHVFKDRKMGDALFAVNPHLPSQQNLFADLHGYDLAGLHLYTSQLYQSVMAPLPNGPSVYKLPSGQPVCLQYQYWGYAKPGRAASILTVVILSPNFNFQHHRLGTIDQTLFKTTFPQAQTWLLAVDDSMTDFQARVKEEIQSRCKLKEGKGVEFEEVGTVDVLPRCEDWLAQYLG